MIHIITVKHKVYLGEKCFCIHNFRAYGTEDDHARGEGGALKHKLPLSFPGQSRLKKPSVTGLQAPAYTRNQSLFLNPKTCLFAETKKPRQVIK